MRATAPIRRDSARELSIKYGAGVIYAHLSAAIAVATVIRVFGDSTAAVDYQLEAVTNLCDPSRCWCWSVLPLARRWGCGTPLACSAGTKALTPTEQQAPVRATDRQAIIQFVLWIGCRLGVWLFDTHVDRGMVAVLGTLWVIGGAVAASMGWLLAQGVMRPVIAAALVSSAGAPAAPPGARCPIGVAWALFTAVPATGIAMLVLAKMCGGPATDTVFVEGAGLVLAVVLTIFSCRAMILASGVDRRRAT